MNWSKALNMWLRDERPLRIGDRAWTRYDAVRESRTPAGIVTMRNVTRALHYLKVTNAKQIKDAVTPAHIRAFDGVGERAVHMVYCIVESVAGRPAADKWQHSDEGKPKPSQDELKKAAPRIRKAGAV